MKEELFTALVSRNLINENCEIRASRETSSTSLTGIDLMLEDFSFQNWTTGADNLRVTLESLRDGRRVEVPVSRIAMIDGQDPVRFAAAHDISATGRAITMGPRRGRAPKAKPVDEEEDY